MSADSYFTGILSFFFRQLISELAERNSTTIGHMLGSKCNLKTRSRNLGYPLPYELGVQKPPFGLTSQLNGNFNRLHLWNETRYRQSVKCVDNYKGSPTLSRNVMNFGPQTASNSTAILPTLRKFCCLLHCQALQTDTSKRNSTKLCQTVDSKIAPTICRRKVGVVCPQKLRAKNIVNICSVFRRLRDLMAIVF